MDILAAVVMVAALVFIHEFGHFIVAKSFGIHVPVFSIGFGRKVLGFKLGGTEYRLSALPFGGYVKMAGANFDYMVEDEDDLPADPSQSFMNRPVWQRWLVVAAGPAFNLALPLFVFTILLMAGEPQQAAVVGGVDRESPAAEAGLQPRDTIVSIDGREVTTFPEVLQLLHEREGERHALVVEREGRRLELSLFLPEDTSVGIDHQRPAPVAGVDDPASPAGRAGVVTGDEIVSVDGVETPDWLAVEEALARAGAAVEIEVDGEELGTRTLRMQRDARWAPAGEPIGTPDQAWGLLPATLFVGGVSSKVDKSPDGFFSGCVPMAPAPESPASRAGIEEGDRFLSIDGAPVKSWGDVLEAISSTMEGDGDEARVRAARIQLVRAGKVVELELTPEIIEDTNSYGHYYYRPILGVTRMGDYVDGPMTRIYYGFGAAVARSVEETTGLMGFIVEQLGKLVTGEAAVKRSLGGPVEIVRQASSAAEQGLFVYARMAGMLSISLGIVNLLPVPVLDGGQLLFFTVEAIRGRPLSHRLRERAQQVGVLFLVLLMLSVLIFDIQKLFEGGG